MMMSERLRGSSILVNLPLMIIGLLLVVIALLEGAWPADYENARYHYVSHWDRLTGNDAPDNLEVNRETGYYIRRTLDTIIYFMVLQGVVAVVGLAWLNERNLYLLLIVSGVYGILYAAGTGLVIGPILTATGFALVLWGAALGYSINSVEGTM